MEQIRKDAKKIIDDIDSNASNAKLQQDVNHFFSNFPVQKDHTPFREFREDNAQELTSLLFQFAGAGGVEAAIALAKHSITDKHLNPNLVKLALGIFLTHDPEAQKLQVVPPSLKQHKHFVPEKMVPLANPVTGDTLKGVNLLSYFREDYDFNDHHWHWHMVYPFPGIIRDGKQQRVIDRQGELFLYMHSQMIARYNAELLSWDLDLLHAWGYDDVLTFGYTPVPGLRDQFGARPPFQGWYVDHSPHLSDSEAPPSRKTMIKWKHNLIESIHEGFFVTKKEDGSRGQLKMTPENACNWVGIIVEAENHPLQEVSPGEFIDRELYGSIHNQGHEKFAEIGYHEYTSPENPMGVMTSNIGSPRDPCFWLWHRQIDDFRQMIVNKYSHSLDEFQPSEVKITNLKIIPDNPDTKTPEGGITTFLGPPDLHLNEADAKLNHEPYRWEITIESTDVNPSDESNPKYFTVRLFIAPAELIDDQRSWIEMDKFTHKFASPQDKIKRKDVESSVARKTTKPGEKLFPWCLCGWPQSMMLPVGKPGGVPYVAFAMLTDDKLVPDKITQAVSFCGAKDHKYPDPRGMGYPFNKTWDRRMNSTAPVREIIKDLPHIMITDFVIYRSTKLYQGSTDDPHPDPPSHITWEKTIKGFFTEKDIKCMSKYKIYLNDKKSVVAKAPVIYSAVQSGNMPQGETRWSKEKVATFKMWMDSGCP